MGFAIDFMGCKEPTPAQYSSIEELLYDFSEKLGIDSNDTSHFVAKMEANDRLAYAIRVLKTIENKRLLGIMYPFFYTVVARLESNEGLCKLNKILKSAA